MLQLKRKKTLYLAMKKIIIIALFLSCIQYLAHSQTTGSFQETVTFDEVDYTATRTLYYHVPEDYDANQSYKLVVGFRGGPHLNAGEFRDQLSFLSDSIGAIILCPENSAHFWNEEGLTKQLFNYSVAHLMQQYNIDTDYVYLTGLSYGGRHAVIVSMDTDAGVIPNLRGVIPFAAGSEADLQPNYDDIIDFPPACICIGLEDAQNFINVSNNLNNDIQSHGGNSMLNEVPNVGHTVDFPDYPNEMMECFNFIEAQYSETNQVNDQELVTEQINLFPNPATDSFSLSFSNAKLTKIKLFDLSGRLIKVFDPTHTIFDLSHVQSGIYSLEITTKNHTVNKKMVIHR